MFSPTVAMFSTTTCVPEAARDTLAEISRVAILLLSRAGDSSRNLTRSTGDLSDRLDFNDGPRRRSLDRLDRLRDIIRRAHSLSGERLHFRGHYRETFTRLASASCFDRGMSARRSVWLAISWIRLIMLPNLLRLLRRLSDGT
jgi:hypothetical protein